MLIDQRRHIRFSLDIPAIRYTKYGERVETVLHQISIGGCLVEMDDSVYIGDEFRLEVQLPGKNRLPLYCKALYKMDDSGIGAKFFDITRFEQELVAQIISHSLERSGLPLQVNPFENPPKFSSQNDPRLTNLRRERDEMLEKILSEK